MSEFWEQILVAVVVICAAVYLIRLSKKTACEKGGCGCAAKNARQQPLAGAQHSTPDTQH
jgi:hypothetical protein